MRPITARNSLSTSQPTFASLRTYSKLADMDRSQLLADSLFRVNCNILSSLLIASHLTGARIRNSFNGTQGFRRIHRLGLFFRLKHSFLPVGFFRSYRNSLPDDLGPRPISKSA